MNEEPVQRFDVSECVAVWVVEGRSTKGLRTSFNFLVLLKLKDGSGHLLSFGGETDPEPDVYVIAPENMGPKVETDATDAAEHLAKRLNGCGREASIRHVEVRSGNPLVIADRVEAAGLTLFFESTMLRGAFGASKRSPR